MKGYIRIAIVAIVVGAGCWFFGLAVIPSIVVVLVIAGVGIALQIITMPTDSTEWPAAPPEARDGTRHEASQLSWAIRAPGGVVDNRVVERVRNIAAESLGRRHLDLADPAHRLRIESLVGAPMYALLVSGDRARVRIPALLAALGVLEALERTDLAARHASPPQP